MLDPHSFCDDAQPKVEQINLELYFDFESQILQGKIELQLAKSSQMLIDLDTKDLEILTVSDLAGNQLIHELDKPSPIKGQRLRIHEPGDGIVITYRTARDALALQWLDAVQTTGKSKPYVFTQCQPIHARSLFPCQDSPQNRIKYHAKLNIPTDLTAVMAAEKCSRSVDGNRAIEQFSMRQAIPSYLFAFAVGNLVHRDIGPRSRVYAEPEAIEAAAYEFAEVESMLNTAEKLFGAYDWERFDLLVMPSSFPYGGMENPRLTFLTPTVIAGDRSLVNILAHELAHSWTGNLVTNATMNDFWLNEGFTTYAERRILEAMEGRDVADLHIAVGRQGLQADLNGFGAGSPFSRLKNDLENVDPDEVFSRVPYEKGFLFVRRLEQIMGRENLDTFLKAYMKHFRFKSITTEEFIDFLRKNEPSIVDKLDLSEWIYGVDLADDAPRPNSRRLTELVRFANEYSATKKITEESPHSWTPQEWQIFLSQLSSSASPELCHLLEEDFDLIETGNLEIRVAFLIMATNHGYEPAFNAAANVLSQVGRMKYLRPLYTALSNYNEKTYKIAKETFEENRGSYHPVAVNLVENILRRKET